MISVEPIAAFSDNYIWCLIDSESRRAAVVDPGDAAPVKAALQQRQLSLQAILITHHHFDHTGGITELLADYPVAVYGPVSDNIPQITHPLREHDTLSLFGLEFSVLAIPGHTLDHIALYCDQSADGPLLFCGDTLFAGGCGRVFEGTAAMMLQSLNKLAALPAATRVYCAHEYTLANLAFADAVEPTNQRLQRRIERDSELRQQDRPTLPSTIADELHTNPFLRCGEDSVISSARRHSGQACANPEQVFAVVRSWKDNF